MSDEEHFTIERRGIDPAHALAVDTVDDRVRLRLYDDELTVSVDMPYTVALGLARDLIEAARP